MSASILYSRSKPASLGVRTPKHLKKQQQEEKDDENNVVPPKTVGLDPGKRNVATWME